MTHALKGTAAKLAKLVQEHGDYEFEGFMWLPTTIKGVAGELDVSEKTIQRVIDKPPFHHVTLNTKEDGRHVLLKLGTEPCETDRVRKLRTVWAKGLVYFNAALAEQLTIKVMQLKSVDAPKALYDRLLHRIADAHKGAKDLEKLKAGEKISLHVHPVQIGQLRGIVQTLGEDAKGTVACLVTFDGWTTFSAYLKTEGRLSRYYHWPQLGVILNNPDIAMQTYLDTLQATAKVDLSESARLLAKIEELKPKDAD